MTTSDQPIPLLPSSTAAAAGAIRRLADEDAVALPILDTSACRQCRSIAATLDYRRASAIVGKGARAVHQDFDICLEVARPNPLWDLAAAIELLLDDACRAIEPSPIDGPFVINDLVLQRYAPGSSGISPHRDHIRYVNLIALVLLGGDGRFAVCDDRAGTNDRVIEAREGDVILLRAPGFDARIDRPFHHLDDIRAERYSLGLRQDSRAG